MAEQSKPAVGGVGLDARIQREDYLDGKPLPMRAGCPVFQDPLAGVSPPDWDGYGGEGDYAGANGNTHSVMTAGHRVRDQLYGDVHCAIDSGERYDCVIVGGGISGLAAAQVFSAQTKRARSCLILENHSVFGGEARRNEFLVEGQPLIANQGSAMFFPPLPGSFIEDFYKSIGWDGKPFRYQSWKSSWPELPLANAPYAEGGKHSAMFFGARFGHPEGLLVTDPWEKRLAGTPFAPQVAEELLRSREAPSHFEPPTRHGDEIARKLDQITLEDVMVKRDRLSRETIRSYFPTAGGGAGASADAISGYADFAPDLMFPWDREAGSQMFPGGNTGIARLLVRTLIPDALPHAVDLHSMCLGRIDFTQLDQKRNPVRIRLNATVVTVQHEGEPDSSESVHVVYAQDGRLFRVKARSVIMAGGWSTMRTLPGLPREYVAAYQQFFRMPCLVANVAVRNWRFMARLGITECQWFEGLGDSLALRKFPTFGPGPQTVSPDAPTILTLKILFTEPGLPLAQQATRGRMRMLATSYSAFEATITDQLSRTFSSGGFDARRDIAGIILNRWGHAYLCAQPGFFFGSAGHPAPRETLRNRSFGRIAFANSDLSGIMDHRASIAEADRAVRQVLA